MSTKSLRGLRRRSRGRLFAALLILGLALVGAVLALNRANFAPGGETATPVLSGTPTPAGGKAAPISTLTPAVLSLQQAVEAAIRIGTESRPEMNGSSIPPSLVDARQTTLLEALRELDSSTSGAPQGEDPNLPVWLVRMDGSWLGAAAPDLPTPVPYLHMTVILNGITGEYILSSNGPIKPQPTLATETPRVSDDALLAKATLEKFLGSLAAGPADQSFYQRAADLYGGSWSELSSVNPGDPKDRPKLLKLLCEQDNYRCLTVRQMSSPEELAARRYRFWVQFSQNDGTLYTNNGTTWFDFEVLGGTGTSFRVLDLPPLTDQNFRPLVAHLSEAETAGLDEAGILRGLWEDYMQRCLSSYLNENERITAYEVVRAQAGGVLFSVRPAKMEYSNWFAGNGETQGDWVRGKWMVVRVFEEGGVWHLKILGSGP